MVKICLVEACKSEYCPGCGLSYHSKDDGQATGKSTKPNSAAEEVLNHLSEVIYQRSYRGAEEQPQNQKTINSILDNIISGKPEYEQIGETTENYDIEVSEQDIKLKNTKTDKSKDEGVIERCCGPCGEDDAARFIARHTALKNTKTSEPEPKELVEPCCDFCGKDDSVQVTLHDRRIKDTKTRKTKHEGVVQTCCDLCSDDDTAQSKAKDTALNDTQLVKPKNERQNTEQDAEIKTENEPQFYEDINKTLSEVVKKRVEIQAKASRLNRLKNKYNNQAINLLEEEYRELCRLREIQLRASGTREARVERKKAGKQRGIRNILRREEFITRSENRDKTFEEKKRREEEKGREKLLKAVNKPMPPSKFSQRLQAILSFVGSSLLLAGIVGIIYKYMNTSGMKTAVDNVFTAIVEGSGSSNKAQGAWSFGSGGTFDPHGRPRDTGRNSIKINEEMLKYPEEKPPMEFTIPGFHYTDEDEEGDFNLGGNLDCDDDD